MTEKQIKEFQYGLPNGSSNRNGDIYYQYRNIDNKYNFSFHIICAKTKSKYNIWYCKIEEKVDITFFDKTLDYNVLANKIKQNKIIFSTNSINELREKVLEIFNSLEK